MPGGAGVRVLPCAVIGLACAVSRRETKMWVVGGTVFSSVKCFQRRILWSGAADILGAGRRNGQEESLG